MADIDKGLPNIKTPLPGGAEEVTDVNIAEVPLKGPVEVHLKTMVGRRSILIRVPI